MERNWFVGKSAVVTGAAQGIGREIALVLQELGAFVVAIDNNERELARRNVGSVQWPGDVANDDVEQLAGEIWQRHGPIQLLANNVGIDSRQRFLDVSRADFDRVFNTNLRGPWFFTQEIARRLVEAGLGGSIVFVSSLHDTIIRTHPHYSASKAAAAMLMKELAHELGPHGIRVNAVSPGRIQSDPDASLSRDDEERGRRFVPLGRVGMPAEVARMAAVLLSDDWTGYVTGANVPVDGGLGLHSWSEDEHAEGRDPLAGRLTRRFAPKR